MSVQVRIAVAFAVSVLASLGLGVTYLSGGQPRVEGALLLLALGGIGIGLGIWARQFMPGGPFVEERDPLWSTEEERRAFVADFERPRVGERRWLLRLLGGALAALGFAALFPIRSLGPRPGRALLETAWRAGSLVVDEDGNPVRADDLEVGGVRTVFPEGAIGRSDSQTVLVRVEPSFLSLSPERSDWAPGGFVAYSKICTHAGCPVGLYQQETHLLLCPCHQSVFDVLTGAIPRFGPATRPLPQLPLEIDEDGFLRAAGEFSAPAGPAFWNLPAAVEPPADD